MVKMIKCAILTQLFANISTKLPYGRIYTKILRLKDEIFEVVHRLQKGES